MNDSTELYTCSLEMKGGLNGINYPQKFVRAPKSDYPSKPPQDKPLNVNDLALKITMGR